MLTLLDAFTADRHVWTVDDLAKRFGYTQPSTYRYIRELNRSGLLVRIPGGEYIIGPRIIELDTLIAETDPLAKVFAPMMKSASELLGCDALLSNVHGHHLINVVHIRAHDQINLRIPRGRPLPWFRGATANSILGLLPRKRVRKIFDKHFEGEKSKENWKKILAHLKVIREMGYCLSEGEIQHDVIGIGAPIIFGRDVPGSVTLVFSKEHGKYVDRNAIGEFIVEKCAECVEKLS